MKAWSQLTNGITGTVVQQASSPGEGWIEVPRDTLPGQVLDGAVYREATAQEMEAAGYVRYARIAGGVVEACTMSQAALDGWVTCPAFVGPGWTFADEEFSPPQSVEDPRVWWIDVGPFKDRLGMDAPAIASSAHSACKGVMALLEGRKYVDLRDAKVNAMLGVLIATNQPTADPVWPGSGPMTGDKRNAILNTPTTEYERHVKNLRG